MKAFFLGSVLLLAAVAHANTTTLIAVAKDSNSPRKHPVVQPFSTPAGETGAIGVIVMHADASTFDLTGSQLLLSVNGTTISRQATITDPAAGAATFPLVIADTLNMKAGAYAYDVWLTDPSGNRWEVVPPSIFTVTPAQGKPDQPVTVPATQAPLALGPALNWKGTWSNAITYQFEDVVSYDDGNTVSSYVYSFNAPSSGSVPTDGVHWSVLAKGRQGSRIESPLGTTLAAEPHIGVDGTLLAATDDAANGRTNITAPGLAPKSRSISTMAPLTGSGTLAADLTLSCPSCVTTARQVATSGAIQGGGDLTADRTLSIILGGVTNAMLSNPSLSITVPSIISGGGSVALGATLALSLATQAANTMLAGPTTGAATTPAFRGLVVADLPASIPNANLANSSITMTTTSPLGGGGAVSLGGSLTLTCATCIVSTGNYADPSWIASLAGSKITGDVPSATTSTSFSGSLAGDVTGTQSTTTVGKLQGRAVSATGPSDRNVLRWIAGNSDWEASTDTSGTVTSVATGNGLQGGAITSTGTIDLRLNASGGLSKTLGAGANELGIATGGVGNTMLANSSFTLTVPVWLTAGSASLGGTLAVTANSQSANSVLAGPTTGAAAAPSFRALVTGDLPTGIPNANLANSSVTVSTSSPLGGGGSVSLGGSLALTCSTCVDTSSAQTLTNKTLTSPAISGPTLSGTVTGTYTLSGTIVVNGVTSFQNTMAVTNRYQTHQTNIADANYTTAATDYRISYTSLTAARVVTIGCTGGNTTQNDERMVKDQSGNASGTNTITITPASGTIDGAASKVCVNSAYGFCRYYSNGTNCFTD